MQPPAPTQVSAAVTEAAATPPVRPIVVRPFPARFAGRFQVRGPVLRAVDKVITDLFGVAARDDVVAHMPDRFAGDLRRGSINALVAYDLEALDAYMEYATQKLLHDPARWRELGRKAVDGELYVVVRTLLRPSTDVGAVVRRGISTWARLFTFGAWRVGTTLSGRVALTIGELDAVAQPLRTWMVGMVEQTTRRAVRADLRVNVTGGDQDFVPELSCEIG
jgi:serine/threonine-protein kinase